MVRVYSVLGLAAFYAMGLCTYPMLDSVDLIVLSVASERSTIAKCFRTRVYLFYRRLAARKMNGMLVTIAREIDQMAGHGNVLSAFMVDL